MEIIFLAFLYTLAIVGLMFVGGTIIFFVWFAIKDSISIIIERNHENEKR